MTVKTKVTENIVDRRENADNQNRHQRSSLILDLHSKIFSVEKNFEFAIFCSFMPSTL